MRLLKYIILLIITQSSVAQTADEVRIVNDINNHRVINNKQPLTINNDLTSLAEAHTDYMINHSVLSHDNFEYRYKEVKTKVGNVKVYECTTRATIGYESEALIESEPHNKVILSEKINKVIISSKGEYTTLIFY